MDESSAPPNDYTCITEKQKYSRPQGKGAIHDQTKPWNHAKQAGAGQIYGGEAKVFCSPVPTKDFRKRCAYARSDGQPNAE